MFSMKFQSSNKKFEMQLAGKKKICGPEVATEAEVKVLCKRTRTRDIGWEKHLRFLQIKAF